jgi:hypothetical protein
MIFRDREMRGEDKDFQGTSATLGKDIKKKSDWEKYFQDGGYAVRMH